MTEISALENHTHNGIDSRKLDSRVLPGGNYARGYLVISSDADQEITVGFKAKLITFTAGIKGIGGGRSHGSGNLDGNSCIVVYNSSGSDWFTTESNVYCINPLDAGGATGWEGKIKAISSSSFTIDWTKNGGASNFYLIYEAYG